jgi:hypothetical protein
MSLPLTISPDLAVRKAELLAYFRSRAAERMVDIDATFGTTQVKKRAAAITEGREQQRLLDRPIRFLETI